MEADLRRRSSILSKCPASSQLTASEKEERAPDGGWGWLVLIGASLILVLVDTVGQCFGVIFSSFLLEMGTGQTTSSWIFNVMSFLWSITGPVLGPVEEEFGWRAVAITFSVVLSLGTILSAFVTSAWMLFLTFSTLAGLGCGVLYNISCMIVPFYFKRRRGLANGVLMAWECGGQFVGPPLINYLQEQYGFRGATLILGAIILNCVIGAIVFHPVEWHLKPPLEGKENNAVIMGSADDPPAMQIFSVALQQGEQTETDQPQEGERPQSTHKTTETLQSPEKIISECQTQNKIIDIHALPDKSQGDGDTRNSEVLSTEDERNREATIVRVIKSTLSDLRILGSARALLIAVSITLLLNSNENFLNMLPFAMQEAGHSLQDVAFGVSISAICNILARIMVSVMTDSPRFNMRICFMTGCFIIVLAMLAFTLLHDVLWLTITLGVWGTGVGIVMSIYILIMIDYMGIEDFVPTFGATMLVTSVGYLVIGPIPGYVRDITGSYTASVWSLCGMMVLNFLLWALMPLAVSWDHHKTKKKNIA